MCAVMWILLRSIWTHMRVCWDIKHTPMYMYLAHVIGWGLPLVFLTLSLSITGVSYRMGRTCIPNPDNVSKTLMWRCEGTDNKQSIVTWFGWLIAFGCLAAMIQFITTGFCVAIYARQLLKRGMEQPRTTTTSTTGNAALPTTPSSQIGPSSKRLAWRRVHRVLLMQWRSIALSVLIIIECLYFGTVYVAQTRAGREAGKPQHVPQIQAWITCLVVSEGDKEKCLHLSAPLGIDENTVVASLFIVSVSYPLVVLTSWMQLLMFV